MQHKSMRPLLALSSSSLAKHKLYKEGSLQYFRKSFATILVTPSALRPPKVEPLSLSFYAVRSHHLLIFVGNSASCALCYTGAVGLPHVKLWLGSQCGLSPFIDSRASKHKPQRLSTLREEWVGGTLLHPSHTLFSLRGLVYCSVCGFVAGHKARKLREICGAGLAICPIPSRS